MPFPAGDVRIESPDAATGAFINAMFERIRAARAEGREFGPEDMSDLVLEGEDDTTLHARILGEDTFAEMTATGSGFAWEDVKLASMTTMTWIASGLDDAQEFFNAGGVVDPPQPPNRAVRRAKVVKAAASARKARTGSTAGTTSRKPAAVRASAGRSSSRTGA